MEFQNSRRIAIFSRFCFRATQIQRRTKPFIIPALKCGIVFLMFVIHVLDVVIIVQCGNIGNRRTPLRAAHIKGAWCGADFKGLRRMTDKNGLAASSDMIWNNCYGDNVAADDRKQRCFRYSSHNYNASG